MSQSTLTAPPSGVGDLALNDFPAPLRPIIAKVNTAVRAARLVRDRSQNSTQFFKEPAAEAFTSVRAAQALLGGTGRVVLQQLADWMELGVRISLLLLYMLKLIL